MDNIESIENNIISIGTMKLTHKVIVGRSNSSKQKISNIIARVFNSSKYSNFRRVKSLKIQTGDFLVFENYTQNNEGKSEAVYFSYPHMYELKSTLQKVVGWFSKYKDLHVETDEGIFLNDKYGNLSLSCFGSSDKKLVFRPNIFEVDGEFCKGVNVIFNDISVCSIELYDLVYLYDFVRSFELYPTSLSLLLLKEQYAVNNNDSYDNVEGNTAQPSSSYKPKYRK